jgi:hypothetical protein
MRDSVTVHIDAPPLLVWGLVADITNTGRFSPETLDAEWTDGFTGPEVGARFRGHVKRNGRGPMYWTRCRVTACVPGVVFEFGVMTSGESITNTWRYEFAANGDGVDVTESFQLADILPLRVYWTVLGWARGETNRRGMTETLQRLKSVAESEKDAS